MKCLVPSCEGCGAVFKIPTKNDLREKWQKAFPFDIILLPNRVGGICVEHFKLDDIMYENACKDQFGKELYHISLNTAKLKDSAVPTIFSKDKPSMKKRPLVRGPENLPELIKVLESARRKSLLKTQNLKPQNLKIFTDGKTKCSLVSPLVPNSEETALAEHNKLSKVSPKPVNVAANVSPKPVNVTANVSPKPVNVAANVSPKPVNVAANVSSKPVNVAANVSPKPVNVAANVSSKPVNVAANVLPKPVNVAANVAPKPVNVAANISPKPVNVAANVSPKPVNVAANVSPKPVNVTTKEKIPQTVKFNQPENSPSAEHKKVTKVPSKPVKIAPKEKSPQIIKFYHPGKKQTVVLKKVQPPINFRPQPVGSISKQIAAPAKKGDKNEVVQIIPPTLPGPPAREDKLNTTNTKNSNESNKSKKPSLDVGEHKKVMTTIISTSQLMKNENSSAYRKVYIKKTSPQIKMNDKNVTVELPKLTKGYSKILEDHSLIMKTKEKVGEDISVYLVSKPPASLAKDNPLPSNKDKPVPILKDTPLPSTKDKPVSPVIHNSVPSTKAMLVTPAKGTPINTVKAVSLHPSKETPATPAKAVPVTPSKGATITPAKAAPVPPSKGTPINTVKAVPLHPSKETPVNPAKVIQVPQPVHPVKALSVPPNKVMPVPALKCTCRPVNPTKAMAVHSVKENLAISSEEKPVTSMIKNPVPVALIVDSLTDISPAAASLLAQQKIQVIKNIPSMHTPTKSTPIHSKMRNTNSTLASRQSRANKEESRAGDLVDSHPSSQALRNSGSSKTTKEPDDPTVKKLSQVLQSYSLNYIKKGLIQKTGEVTLNSGRRLKKKVCVIPAKEVLGNNLSKKLIQKIISDQFGVMAPYGSKLFNVIANNLKRFKTNYQKQRHRGGTVKRMRACNAKRKAGNRQIKKPGNSPKTTENKGASDQVEGGTDKPATNFQSDSLDNSSQNLVSQNLNKKRVKNSEKLGGASKRLKPSLPSKFKLTFLEKIKNGKSEQIKNIFNIPTKITNINDKVQMEVLCQTLVEALHRFEVTEVVGDVEMNLVISIVKEEDTKSESLQSTEKNISNIHILSSTDKTEMEISESVPLENTCTEEGNASNLASNVTSQLGQGDEQPAGSVTHVETVPPIPTKSKKDPESEGSQKEDSTGYINIGEAVNACHDHCYSPVKHFAFRNPRYLVRVVENNTKGKELFKPKKRGPPKRLVQKLEREKLKLQKRICKLSVKIKSKNFHISEKNKKIKYLSKIICEQKGVKRIRFPKTLDEKKSTGENSKEITDSEQLEHNSETEPNPQLLQTNEYIVEQEAAVNIIEESIFTEENFDRRFSQLYQKLAESATCEY